MGATRWLVGVVAAAVTLEAQLFRPARVRDRCRGTHGDVDGSVRAAVVGRSLDPEMDESVIEGVRRWQFEPATRDGKPVTAAVRIDLMFSLRK